VLTDERFGESLNQRLHEAVEDLVVSPAFFGALRRRHRRRVHTKRAVIGVIPVALLVIAGALVVGHRPAVTSSQLVSFRTASNGTVTAVITDPLAAKRQLDAVFRRHGLDISVTVVPASPSVVGTIVYTDVPTISSIDRGACYSPGQGCPVGLVISASFRGQGVVTVGRAARPGEAYESSADSLDAGEALHCSGILNEQASTALPVVRARGLGVEWREMPGTSAATPDNRALAAPPPGAYVVDATPISSKKVLLWLAPQPDLSNPAYIQSVNRGC
jgi:hypothetical protein